MVVQAYLSDLISVLNSLTFLNMKSIYLEDLEVAEETLVVEGRSPSGRSVIAWDLPDRFPRTMR